MNDDGVGRLLVASLHQSIGDVLPQRLDYYEHWLSPMGLRDRRNGLAPLLAVLSFLRLEGPAAYAAVMRTAGGYSAEWYEGQGRGPGMARVFPRAVRRRLALRRSRGLLRDAYARHRVETAVRRGQGTVVVDGSVFCGLREHSPWPTCDYAAGAVERQLALRGIESRVTIAACHAQGAARCTLAVDFEPAAATEAG